MKIAFVSTRGIPNNYGGFEQFAEYISVGLARRGHEVTVYSPHYHPYKEKGYKGVRIKHIYSPEKWMGGSVGSFFYDYACLKDALRREDFDIIYEAGYTSIIPAYIRFNVKAIRRPVFATNMDGLEYKRIASAQYGKRPLIIVGKTNTPYGKWLVERYRRYEHVRFVGGTNPSLLEAMASECFILSHDNIFNRAVLGERAVYYGCTDDAMQILNELDSHVSAHKVAYTAANLEVIRRDYSWEKLVDEHEKYFLWMLEDAKKRKQVGNTHVTL